MPPHAADEVRHKAARSQSEGSLPSLAVVTMVKLRARAMRLKHLTLGADTMEALSLAVEEQSSPAVAAEGQHLLALLAVGLLLQNHYACHECRS